MEPKVLYEDKELIVVIKPAGVQSQSSSGFEDDMVSLIKKHIAGATGSEPYVGVIHRLDTMVEGVMVYAKTKEAAAALSKQVRDGDIGKKYQAVLCGIPKEKSGKLSDYLLQDNKANMSRVVAAPKSGTKPGAQNGKSASSAKSGNNGAGDTGAKLAELNYKLIDKKFVGGEQFSRVEIELLTGRHHQIRVQFSSRNLPILGDVKYGGRKADRLYLVSNEISFTHPKTKKKMTYKGCELQIPQ
jgi:23S rRNA pseudouridine1911/1915/1917 synthase